MKYKRKREKRIKDQCGQNSQREEGKQKHSAMTRTGHQHKTSIKKYGRLKAKGEKEAVVARA